MCVIKVRVLQLKQEQEKCRVLEEALNVLAKEHHELEQSMASHLSASPSHHEQRCSSISSPRSPRFYDTSDDEFYDAFEAGVFITSVIITFNCKYGMTVKSYGIYFPSNAVVYISILTR